MVECVCVCLCVCVSVCVCVLYMYIYIYTHTRIYAMCMQGLVLPVMHLLRLRGVLELWPGWGLPTSILGELYKPTLLLSIGLSGNCASKPYKFPSIRSIGRS